MNWPLAEVVFASVKAALAAATSAVGFGGQGLTQVAGVNSNTNGITIDCTDGIVSIKRAGTTIAVIGPSGQYLRLINANVPGVVDFGLDLVASPGDAQLRSAAGGVVLNAQGGNFLLYIGGALRLTGSTAAFAFDLPLGLKSYTVATLPAATTAGRVIYVSDETGGGVIAFSDGANWRRVTDRNIVS
jgi:hypothetical protein